MATEKKKIILARHNSGKTGNKTYKPIDKSSFQRSSSTIVAGGKKTEAIKVNNVQAKKYYDNGVTIKQATSGGKVYSYRKPGIDNKNPANFSPETLKFSYDNKNAEDMNLAERVAYMRSNPNTTEADWQWLASEIENPSSIYFNQYWDKRPVQSSVAENYLREYFGGYTGEFDEEFFKQTSDFANYEIRNSKTGPGILSPGSNGTPEQWVAYYRVQLQNDMDKQRKVDEQWNALRSDMKSEYDVFKLIHDREPTYDELMAKIDMSNYDSLKDIDDSRNLDWGTSHAPVELNSGTYYMQESLAGVFHALTQGLDVSEDRNYFEDAVEYYSLPMQETAITKDFLAEKGYDTSIMTFQDYENEKKVAAANGDHELFCWLNHAQQVNGNRMDSLIEKDYITPRYGVYHTDDIIAQMKFDVATLLEEMTVNGEVQKPKASDEEKYHYAWAVYEIISKQEETQKIEAQVEAFKSAIASRDKAEYIDEAHFAEEAMATLENYPELKDYIEGKTTANKLCRPVFFDGEAVDNLIKQTWNGSEEEKVVDVESAEVPFGYDEQMSGQAQQNAANVRSEEEQMAAATASLTESGTNISESQWRESGVRIAPTPTLESDTASAALVSLAVQSNSKIHSEKVGPDATLEQIASIDPTCKALLDATGAKTVEPLTLNGLDELLQAQGVGKMDGGSVTVADGVVRAAIPGLEDFSAALDRAVDRYSGTTRDAILNQEFDLATYNSVYNSLKNRGFTGADAADGAMNAIIYATPGLNNVKTGLESDAEVNENAADLTIKIAEADGFAESVVLVSDIANGLVEVAATVPEEENFFQQSQKLVGDMLVGMSEYASPVYAAETKDLLNDILHGDITNEDIKDGLLEYGRQQKLNTALGMAAYVHDEVQDMAIGEPPLKIGTEKYDALSAEEKHEANKLFNQKLVESDVDISQEILFYANTGGQSDFYKNGRAVSTDYEGRNDFYMYNSALLGDLDEGERLHWKVQETKGNYGKWFTYDEMNALEEAVLSGYITEESFDRIVKKRVSAHTESYVWAIQNDEAIAANLDEAKNRLENNKVIAAKKDEAYAASYNEQDAHYVNKALGSINEGNDIVMSVRNSGAADVIGLDALIEEYGEGTSELNSAIMQKLNTYAESEGAQLMYDDDASDLSYTTAQIETAGKLIGFCEQLGPHAYDVIRSITPEELKLVGIDLKAAGFNKGAMDILNEITDYSWQENYQRDGMDFIDNLGTAAFDAYMGIGNIAVHGCVWVKDGLGSIGIGEGYDVGDGSWTDSVLQFERATDERYATRATVADRFIGTIVSETLGNRLTGLIGAGFAKVAQKLGVAVKGASKLDDAAAMIKGGIDDVLDIVKTNKLYSAIGKVPFAAKAFGGSYMMNREEKLFLSASLRSFLDAGIELLTETDTVERFLEAMDVTKLVAGASDDALFYAARVIKDVKQEVGQEILSMIFGRFLDAAEARDVKALVDGLGDEAKDTVVTTMLITLLGAAMDAPMNMVSGYSANKYLSNQDAMSAEEIESLLYDFALDMLGENEIEEPETEQPSVQAAKIMNDYRAGNVEEEAAKSELETVLSGSESETTSPMDEAVDASKNAPISENEGNEYDPAQTPVFDRHGEQNTQPEIAPSPDLSKGAQRVFNYESTAEQGKAEAVGQQAANKVIEEGMANDPGIKAAEEAVSVAQEEVTKVEQETEALNNERKNVIQQFKQMIETAISEGKDTVSPLVQNNIAQMQQKRSGIEGEIAKKAAALKESRDKLAKAKQKAEAAKEEATAVYNAEAEKTKQDIAQRYLAARAYMEEPDPNQKPEDEKSFNVSREDAPNVQRETAKAVEKTDEALPELQMNTSLDNPEQDAASVKQNIAAYNKIPAKDASSVAINNKGPSLREIRAEEEEYQGGTTADRDESKSEFFKVPEHAEVLDEEFGIVGSAAVFKKLWNQIGDNTKINVPVDVFNKLRNLAGRVFGDDSPMINAIFRSSLNSEQNAGDRVAAIKGQTVEDSEARMERVVDSESGETRRYVRNLERLKSLGFAVWRESADELILRNLNLKSTGYIYSDQKARELDNNAVNEKHLSKISVSNFDRWAGEYPDLAESQAYIEARDNKSHLSRMLADMSEEIRENGKLADKLSKKGDTEGANEAKRYLHDLRKNALSYKAEYEKAEAALRKAQLDLKQAVHDATRTERHTYCVIKKSDLQNWWDEKTAAGNEVAGRDQDEIKDKYIELISVANYDADELFDMFESDLRELGFGDSTFALDKKTNKMVKVPSLNSEGEKIMGKLYDLYGAGASEQDVVQEFLRERFKIIAKRAASEFESKIPMQLLDTGAAVDKYMEDSGAAWSKLGVNRSYYVDPAFLSLASYMRSQLTNLNKTDEKNLKKKNVNKRTIGWDSIEAKEMLELGSAQHPDFIKSATEFADEYAKRNNLNKDERNALIYMLTETESGSKRFGYTTSNKVDESGTPSYADVTKVSRDGSHSMYLPSYNLGDKKSWANKSILNEYDEYDIGKAKDVLSRAYSYIKGLDGNVKEPIFKITVSMYDDNGILHRKEVGKYYKNGDGKSGSRYMPTLTEILEKSAIVRVEGRTRANAGHWYNDTDFSLENDKLKSAAPNPDNYVDEVYAKAHAAFSRVMKVKHLHSVKGTDYSRYIVRYMEATAAKLKKDIRSTISDFRMNNDKWGKEHTIKQADELKAMRKQLSMLEEMLASGDLDALAQEIFTEYKSRESKDYVSSKRSSVRELVSSMLNEYDYAPDSPEIQAANTLVENENVELGGTENGDLETAAEDTESYKNKISEIKQKFKNNAYNTVDDVIADMVELDSYTAATNYNPMDKAHRDLQLKLDELLLEGKDAMTRGHWYYTRSRSLAGKTNKAYREAYNKKLAEVLKELEASPAAEKAHAAEETDAPVANVEETPVQNSEPEKVERVAEKEEVKANVKEQAEKEYDVYSELMPSDSFEDSERHILNQDNEVRRIQNEIDSLTSQSKAVYDRGFAKAYEERDKKLTEIRNKRVRYSAETEEYKALDREFRSLNEEHLADGQGKEDYARYQRLESEKKELIADRDRLKKVRAKNRAIHFGSKSALDTYTGRSRYELYKSIPGTNDLSPRKAAQKALENLKKIRKDIYGNITTYTTDEVAAALAPLFNQSFFNEQAALASSVRNGAKEVLKENADLEFENAVIGYFKAKGKVTTEDIREAKELHAQAYESIIRVRGGSGADVADYEMSVAEARKKANKKADAIFKEYYSGGMSGASETELLKRSDEIGNVKTGKIAENQLLLSRMQMNAKALSALGNGNLSAILNGRYGGDLPSVLMDVVLGAVMDVTEGKNGKVRKRLMNAVANSDLTDSDMDILLDYFDNDRDFEWLEKRTGFDGTNYEQSDYKRLTGIIDDIRNGNKEYANKHSNPQDFIAKVFGSSERMIDRFFGDYAPLINAIYVQPMLHADDVANAERDVLIKEMDKKIPNKNIDVLIDGKTQSESLSAVVHRIIEDRPFRKDIADDYDYLMTRFDELGIKDRDLRDEVYDAVEWTREYFHNMIERENESRYSNGLPLIPVRGKGWYVPTLKKDNSFFGKLGINTKIEEIPGHLLGKTGDFKPVAQFDATHLQRDGHETDYDVKESIKNTITANLNTVHQLTNTIRLRQLADAFQGNPEIDDAGNYVYDGEGDSKRLKYDHANHGIFGVDENGKAYAGNRASAYQELFTSLANRSANKKSGLVSRSAEEKGGRAVYAATNLKKSMSTLSKVAFNFKSSMNNLQPVIQIAVENPFETMMAIGSMLKNKAEGKEDYVSRNSKFVAARSAYAPEESAIVDKLMEKGFWLASHIDKFSTNVVVRAAMLDAANRGGLQNHPDIALMQAEDRARRLMTTKTRASRSAFYDDAILSTAFQFTSEGVNSLFYTFGDAKKYAGSIPRYVMKTMALFVAYAMYNYFTGSESMPDVYGSAKKTVATMGSDASTGDKAVAVINSAFKTLVPYEVDTGEAGEGLGNTVAALIDSTTGEGEEDELVKAFGELGLELMGNIVPGYEQWKRVYKTFDAVDKGYAKTSTGTIKHTVDKGDFLSGITFGLNSTKKGRDYVYGGYKGISGENATKYEEAVNTYGEDADAAWERLYENNSKALTTKAENVKNTSGMTGEEKLAAQEDAAAAREQSGAPADLALWASGEYSTEGSAAKIGVDLWKQYGVNTYPTEINASSYSIDDSKYKIYEGKGYELTEEDYSAINAIYQKKYNVKVKNKYNDGMLKSKEGAEALAKELSSLKTKVVNDYIKNEVV